MPAANPTIGAGSFALFLGGKPVERPDTVWVEPWFKSIKDVEVAFNENNPCWLYQMKLINRLLELGKDKFLVSPSTGMDGLDILSLMLGSQQLVYDIMDYPEIVIEKNRLITDQCIKLCERQYDIIRDKSGGSVYLCWSPGRAYRGQCDFSAMLSPQLFKTIGIPDLRRLFARMDHTIYHMDGPGALCHQETLLEMEEMDVLQWVPGAGNPQCCDRKWWYIYHKTFEAGKKMQIFSQPVIDDLLPLKKEFGKNFRNFMIIINQPFNNKKDAVDAINLLSE